MTKPELTDTIASLESLPLETRVRDDGLQRILAARSRGDRRQLPTTEQRWRMSRVFTIGVAAAALILASVILFDRAANELIAGTLSGELTFSNSTPAAGARIKVAYKPAESLSKEAELLLRARFRTRWGPLYNRGTIQTTAAVLKRQRSGLYEGEFVLPDSAVYMAAVIENRNGIAVDDHRGYLWDVIVHADGKPALAGLMQQFADVIGRSPDSALAIARRTTEVHPQSPHAWAQRLGFETYMLGPPGRQAVLPKAQAVFDGFDRAQRSASPSPDLIDQLLSLAPQIGSTATEEASRYWSHRLLSLSESSAIARYYRMTRMNSRVLRDSSQAPAALDSVNRFWNAGDSLHPMVPRLGFQIAQRAGDSAAVFTWASRLAASDPLVAAFAWQQVAATPRFRKAAIAETRRAMQTIEHLGADRRDLGLTVREDSVLHRDWYRMSQVALGTMLLTDGDTTAALRELKETTTDGWDLDRFDQVGQLLAKSGDSIAASRQYAMIIVDPATPASRRDSLQAAFIRHIGPAELRAARDAMFERVSSRAISRPLSDSLSLTTTSGGTARLGELLGGKPGVILVWSRFCGISRAQLGMLNDVKAVLDRLGIRFIPVTVEAPHAEVSAVLTESGARWDSYYDVGGTMRQSLHNIATPEFYVIDAAGRVRFESSSPWLSVTQANAIK